MKTLPEIPRSYWLDSYGEYTPQPPLKGEVQCDVAIIGGGFTGMATALELKRAEPSMRICVLEAQHIGYGASGRNGSFAMTVVGLGFGATAMLKGKLFLKEAHSYMEQAVDDLDAFIQQENLDCDRIRPGFLRVATTEGYIRKLQHDIELMHSLGFTGIEWLEKDQVQEKIHSPRYLGAMFEERLLLINPLKLVREERRLNLEAGVQIFENSPAIEIQRNAKFTIKTPSGSVISEKIVFATNAYSHLIPHLRRKQIPAFTYMIATAPLTAEQLEQIGWKEMQGIEDARNLIHYYRLTLDKRILIGGGPVGLTYANSLFGDENQRAWRHLEEHLQFLFPHIKNLDVTHRWGGPFSVTVDLNPVIGAIGDQRAWYSLGCIGHGVSMSHRNAKVLRDLVLEKKSDVLDNPFFSRKTIPWPPEPLRIFLAGALRGYLSLEDAWYERALKK